LEIREMRTLRQWGQIVGGRVKNKERAAAARMNNGIVGEFEQRVKEKGGEARHKEKSYRSNGRNGGRRKVPHSAALRTTYQIGKQKERGRGKRKDKKERGKNNVGGGGGGVIGGATTVRGEQWRVKILAIGTYSGGVVVPTSLRIEMQEGLLSVWGKAQKVATGLRIGGKVVPS